MKKMFIGNLSPSANEDSVRQMFSAFGTVRSVRVATDVFTGKSRGFGFVEMEGHEARAALAALDGKTIDNRPLKVRFDTGKHKRR
jgi:RNA recognition motif-containing protein